jgi:DHA1 family multidrug/chloramphenicol efflux transport protein-like MFS transporter
MQRFFPFFLVFFEACVYLSNDAYLPSMPAIERDLAAHPSLLQATLSLWFLGAGLLPLILGPLCDRLGQKPVLLSGCWLFIKASIMCGLAPNIEILLAARLFQGMSVGFVIVAGYGSIHEMFSSVRAVKILSIMASIIVIAPALGPLMGALIAEAANWRAVFWVLVGLAFIALAGLAYTMPNSQKKTNYGIKQILQGYKALLLNRRFVLFHLMFGCVLSIFLVWIVTSPFIIMQVYQKTSICFGVVQAFVCGSLILGSQLTRYMITRYKVSHIIRVALYGLGMSISTLAIASTTIKQPDLYLVTFVMMVTAASSSVLFSVLGRLGIESSNEPIGRKMAMGSTIMNVVISLVTSLAAVLQLTHFGPLFMFLLALIGCLGLLYTKIDIHTLKLRDNK